MPEEQERMQYTKITEGTERLQAFSDAIFAFAVTLLGINLAVPVLQNPAKDSLLKALLQMWPYFFGFITSFIIVGITWANHHEMFRFIKRSNHYFLLLNIIFLMTIALIPFPTAVLAQYIVIPTQRVTATAFYSGTLLAMSIMYNIVWLYALKNNLMAPQCNPDVLKIMTRGYLLGPILFSIAFILAFIWYPASLALNIFAYFIFLLPSPNRPIYLHRHRHK